MNWISNQSQSSFKLTTASYHIIFLHIATAVHSSFNMKIIVQSGLLLLASLLLHCTTIVALPQTDQDTAGELTVSEIAHVM